MRRNDGTHLPEVVLPQARVGRADHVSAHGGPGDPVALVGERRIGKTSHLLFELIPAAEKRGFATVYIDVYQHRAKPLAAINYALQEAIDDLEVPRSSAGRRLKTTVKKIAVGAASLELGEEPSRKRPDDPFLLVDWLLKVLVRTAKRPVLVLFDEVQELATVANGENVVSAIRSAITKSKSNVRVVFTGSSQEKLLELFSRSRAALYEGRARCNFRISAKTSLRTLHSGAGNVSRSVSP